MAIERHIEELKDSLESGIESIREDVRRQTVILSAILAEQRNDFRQFIESHNTAKAKIIFQNDRSIYNLPT